MKCDGNKPMCNQCVRFNRTEECEYSEVSTPSTARVLEQHIARLQSRIHELEQDDPSAVRLHDPHAAYKQSEASTSRPQAGQEWWDMPEPPPQITRNIVNRFLPFATTFGFFFDKSAFLTALFSPTVSKPRPPIVLRNVVYLWGVQLSTEQEVQSRVPIFLNRALRSIHVALSTAQQQDTLYVLQAEILLAYFFFHNGRLAEGKFHSNAAVSLAIMCNLHKVAAPQRRGSQDVLFDANTFLPPPRDAVEEGERIHAFWTTFVLDKCWIVALGSPSILIEDQGNSSTRIDSPWPQNMEHYGQRPISPNPGCTISKFLETLSSGNDGGDSSRLATLAKAAALYERADRLASLWEKDIMANQEDFVQLDSCIERFKQTLPAPERLQSPSIEMLHSLLVVHTLSQCATIQLHVRFVMQSSASRGRCLSAANAVVRIAQVLPIQQMRNVSPIMAVFYTSTHDILLGGLRSLRSMRSDWASSSAMPGYEALETTLKHLVTITEHFAISSPIMNSQLAKIRQAHAST
ncbi:hypothetical protein EUX98_g839 [Antrodiella citrinella]|uniref:Xylanolytic transcriptional activator regulatory domain-containing protein n=1 Tax=Antrodiella citrinella TaxID=2447956 RepID=A0A4S4N4M5_9APHY|nr:hypothetical protein EUX98_g839 [Antrodiella citrinella]